MWLRVRPNVKYTDRVRLHPDLEARERVPLQGPGPDYARPLRALRRTLIIIDYDFGRVEHRIDLYRTGRIDC